MISIFNICKYLQKHFHLPDNFYVLFVAQVVFGKDLPKKHCHPGLK